MKPIFNFWSFNRAWLSTPYQPLVKSSERKSPITELKTNIKISNLNKQEFNKQDTSEGKINVKIVTMDMKK